jgi:hypothetical protein
MRTEQVVADAHRKRKFPFSARTAPKGRADTVASLTLGPAAADLAQMPHELDGVVLEGSRPNGEPLAPGERRD